MFSAIANGILKLLLPLVGWFIKRSKINDDLKSVFYDFVGLAKQNREELVEIRHITLEQYKELEKFIDGKEAKSDSPPSPDDKSPPDPTPESP